MSKCLTIFAALAPLLASAASAAPSITLQFDSARYRLGPEERQILEEFWSQLPAEQLGQLRFQVEGRADPMGSLESNRELAARRAQSLRDWLSRRGVAKAAISHTAEVASQADGQPCPATLPREDRVTCLAPARRATIRVTLPPEPVPADPAPHKKPVAAAAPEVKEEPPVQQPVAEGERATQVQTARPALYLALDVQQAIGSRTARDFTSAMERNGVDVDISDYDVRRPAWQLALGYRYHPRMAVEFGYLDLGEVRFDFDTEAGDTALTSALENSLPFSGSGWTLANRFDLPLGQWRASVSAGLYSWRDDPTTGNRSIDPDSSSGTDPLIGLEAARPLSENIELGLQYRRLFLDEQELDLWGARIAWHL